jgi:hypothetical protein
MFNSDKCITSGEEKKNTCYDDKSLLLITKILNKQGYKININNDSKKIYSEIKKILSKIGTCKDEMCWLTMDSLIQNLSKKELNKLKSNFKPPKPESWNKDNDKWLTTEDIEKILNRYMNVDNKFYSYGALPIDSFDKKICINKLCDFNLKKHIDDKKEKIAIVYNTDEHGEPGQHWISLYIDVMGNNLKDPCIYFFDSYGDKPPEEINEFVQNVMDQGKNNGIDFKYTYNDKQHQMSGGECGIYCLHFITYMKDKGNFKTYINNKKSDKYMNKFRNYFYD